MQPLLCAAIRDTIFEELLEKKYNTVVIDPPWNIEIEKNGFSRNDKHRAPTEMPYQTMTLDEIKQFPISDFANIGAHVYCWTTNKRLRDAFDVLQAWGVNFHIVINWLKTDGMAPAMGYVYGAEYCLLGFFGRPMQKFTSIGALNWLKTKHNGPGEHSKKPDAFYRLVEKMSPEPYIDIFSRQRRYGWESWGNEVPEVIPPIEDYTF